MAIRERIRAKFSSKNKRSSTSSAATTELPEGYYMGRTDIEYYKPNEIPKSKYRGRIDKVHQEQLDSFSFSFNDSFGSARRPSAALSGTFSPGGTKAFSRRTSYASNLLGRSRRTSLSSDENASFSIPSSSSESTHMKRLGEDVSSTGLDKQATVTKNPDSNHIEHKQSSEEMPFTPEELTQAMTRATITPQTAA